MCPWTGQPEQLHIFQEALSGRALKEREGRSHPSPHPQVAPGGWSKGGCGVGTVSLLCPVPRRA